MFNYCLKVGGKTLKTLSFENLVKVIQVTKLVGKMDFSSYVEPVLEALGDKRVKKMAGS